MANVIIFTDIVPRNLKSLEDPFYIRYQTRPAGAYALASQLRHQGYSVLVVDHCASYTYAGISKIINDNCSDLLWVGLSTTFFNTRSPKLAEYREHWNKSSELFFEDSLASLVGDHPEQSSFISPDLVWGSYELNRIAYLCAKRQAPLIVGGAWITTNGTPPYLHKNIYMISGRAESYVNEVTNLLAKDKSAILPVAVSNTQYDNTDFKTNSYLWTESDLISPDDWLPLEIARGCAFNCAYCSYDRRALIDSYRNPDSIREEILRNYEKFGTTRYLLMDDLYNDSKEKIRVMYNKVWSRLPFKPEWGSYMRLDMCWADPESLQILKDSGVRMASFGIETLSDVAGRKVGKGLGKKRILDTLNQVKKIWGDDVLTHAFFIMGLPDETEESMLETLEWIKTTDLVDSISCNPLWIEPPNKHAMSPNAITKDNEKYNISWLSPNNWINRHGVTFKRACELSSIGNEVGKAHLGSFGDYAEHRQNGFAHDTLVQYRNDDSCVATIKASQVAVNKITSKVKARLGIE